MEETTSKGKNGSEGIELLEDGDPLRTTSMSTFNYLHLDADKVLTAFGKYGRYQMLTYFITSSVQMLFAINMMVMPFITKEANFTCDFEKKEHWVFSRIPDNECTIMDSNNWTLTCSQIPGSRYLYNETHTTMAAEFNLVCENYHSIEHGTSIFLLGGMLVSPLITQLSDSFGRRLTFLVPLYLAVISNLICAFAPTFTVFLVFRFISGVATTSFSMIGYVLCMESVALEFRSMIPLLGTITWVLGYMLAGVFHIFIPNWRWLYVAVSIPGILTIPFYWLLPESVHWLITNKKGKRVEKYINASTAFNNMKISLPACKSESDIDGNVVRKTALDMFLNPSIMFHLLIHSYILIAMNSTYWALSLFSTELSDDGLIGYFLSGFVELPAGLLSVGLLLLLDRKSVSFLSLTLTSVFMCCALYLPVSANIKMIFTLLAKSVNAIVWSSQPLLYTESMPTPIRNVFCGIVCFVGDIGSVIAPYLKRLEAINKNAPALFIAVMSIIAAICVIFLPETKGRKLPEDFRDFDAGPLLRRFHRRQNTTPPSETEPVSDQSIPLQSSSVNA